MKKIISCVLICVFILSLFTFPVASEEAITVMVNGETLESDVPAQTLPVYDEQGGYVGDRVMVPLRAISEKLNADVYWDDETCGITLYRKNNLYIMWEGMDTAFHLEGLDLNKSYTMDVAPTVIDDRTLVPARAVAEILGATVNWIEETNTVDISYELGEIEENATLAQQCNAYQYVLNDLYDEYKAYANGSAQKTTGKIILESGDEIKFEVYPQIAPQTANNFIFLAKEGFYDGTVFHRVIKDFMAQGGAYDTTYTYKPSHVVAGEFIMNGYLNLIGHKRGVISLARADDYNSGSSQFFIVQKDSQFLDGGYAAFGLVTEGMDIVDKICDVETDENDKPIDMVVIKQIIID
ncbi:MAG: hypothetical protein E7410_03660 [Ruminococcaceae bacterium]|nr:hypothetical protein [Oscillospiraceae bacterium]